MKKIDISIAGAFNHYNEIMLLYLKNKDILKNSLTVFDGYNDSVWNGCRTYVEAPTAFSLRTLNTYNNLGISVAITFSNDIIDVSLGNENKLLAELNKSGLNSVILVNEELRKHIKENYKNLKVMYSVSGFETLDFSKIKHLEQTYDKICPRYEWVFNPDFYNFADVSKYKVMMNDTCKYNCKFWGEHFKAINKLNREKCKDPEISNALSKCWIANEMNNPDIGWKCYKDKYSNSLGMDLNVDAVTNALKIGYRSFKISGREFAKHEFTQNVQEQLNILRNALCFL